MSAARRFELVKAVLEEAIDREDWSMVSEAYRVLTEACLENVAEREAIAGAIADVVRGATERPPSSSTRGAPRPLGAWSIPDRRS